MSKELRELLQEFDNLKNKTNELLNKNNWSEADAVQSKELTAKLKNCKEKLIAQSKIDGIENLHFDVNGYPCIDGDNSHVVDDFQKGTKLTDDFGGVPMKNKNFRMYNKSDDLLKAYKNEKSLDLGKYIRGSLTGRWDNAEAERIENVALSTSTGPVLIPQSLSAQILAKVMNRSLIYGSGVPMVDMPSGNLTIAKVTKNPEVSFKGENQVAAGVTFDSTKGTYSTGSAEFQGITLKSKTIYGICKVSDEILYSAENLTEVLTQAFSDALADGIDKACIYGTGAKNVDGSDNPNPPILGIANTTGINTVPAGGTINTVHYTPFIKAVGAIRKNNGEPTTLGINSDIDTSLNLLTNSNGDPLGIPQVVSNLSRVVSNNLRNNLGTGTDESEALIFDPASMLIGQQVQVAFQVSNQAMDSFATGSTYFRIYCMLDLAVLRPENITRITELK